MGSGPWPLAHQLLVVCLLTLSPLVATSGGVPISPSDAAEGSITLEVQYKLPEAPVYPPIYADFDGDGAQEVIVASDDSIMVLQVTYGVAVQVVLESTLSLPFDLLAPPVAGDVDANGTYDIVAVGLGEAAIISSSGWRTYFNTTGRPVCAPMIHDTNGDGVPEIIVATDLGLFAYNSSGALIWKVWVEGIVGDAIFPLSVGAVVVASLSNGTLLKVSPSGYPSTAVIGENISAPVVVDLDSDGEPEILLADAEGRVIATDLLGNVEISWEVPPSPSAPVSWDIDADGKGDVVLLYKDSIRVLYWWGEREIQAPEPVQAIVADADADGMPELVVADSQGLEVFNWKGEAEYSSEEGVIPGSEARIGLAAGNLDGTGGSDTVVVTESSMYVFSSVHEDKRLYCWAMAGGAPTSTSSIPLLDNDSDWLPDSVEGYVGTDPGAPDTDGDGMPDGWEYFYGLDPKNPADRNSDDDEDGLSNIMEFLYNCSPKSSDTDGDGMPDGWEIRYSLNPRDPSDAQSDADGDGLSNQKEYEYGTDPWKTDTDGDGMPDGWEIRYSLNPRDPSDAQSDADGDGLSNQKEYEYGTDPRDEDTDNDKLPDGDEVARGTNPLSPDTDGDGLLDGDEVARGTNPLSPDTDGDGLSDAADPFPTIAYLPHAFGLLLLIPVLIKVARRREKKGLDKLVRKRVKVKA